MKKLVTISREYGSGGRIIGRLVAEKLGIPFYDKEILDMAAEQSGLSREIVDRQKNVSIIEVNPRSSRTVPFLSKATGYPYLPKL